MEARPSACLIRSMSRAVLKVLSDGSRDAARCWHRWAMAVNAGAPGSGWPAADGTGTTLVNAEGGVPHRRGSLAPVPRGSKLTMSKCWRTAGGRLPSVTGRIWFPLSPGPPGLNTSVPVGPEGSVAGARVTATGIDARVGCR